MKYAVVERERRHLVGGLPAGVTSTSDIVDRYLTGTRLRLREVREADGSIVRKLCLKVRVGSGRVVLVCSIFYLDEDVCALVVALGAS